MRKLVYILSVGGLLIAASCNEPAKFDQAACDRRADSIAVARVHTEMPNLSAESSEMCAQQLAVLTATRDSLDMILNTASSSKGSYKGGKKGTTTTTTTTTTGKDDNKLDVKGDKNNDRLDVKGDKDKNGGRLKVN